MTLLNFGIDSLNLRLAPLSAFAINPIYYSLDLIKSRLGYGETCPVELPGVGTFELKSFGTTPYAYLLTNPLICDIHLLSPGLVGKPIGRDTGFIYVSFRSVFLHGRNLNDLRQFVDNIAKTFVLSQSFWCKVSKVDLFCDSAVSDGLGFDDLSRFVSVARLREAVPDRVLESLKAKLFDSSPTSSPTPSHTPPQSVAAGGSCPRTGASSSTAPLTSNTGGANSTLSLTSEELAYLQNLVSTQPGGDLSRLFWGRGVLESLYFGSRKSALFARIYDKHLEIRKQSHKNYLLEHWAANDWDGLSPVWRVEFSLSGDFLASCALDDLHSKDLRPWDSFVNAYESLWSYLTTRWLRHCDLSATRLTNCPASEWWAVVQSAFDAALVSPVVRLESQSPVDLTSQIKGCLLSHCASSLDSLATISTVLGAVFSDLLSLQWLEKFNKRRSRFGLDTITLSHYGSNSDLSDFSDTVFSELLRSVRMGEGAGS